ncbi:MAG: methenyltetrahydrofolate cyclohydrolase [Methanobacteriota archaeon]|nr:MAG: methenyltetrahydrofolate cyclohydrolase [Euryarchaeota archaeon]|tara:strand:+ start:41556 stop:42188 length:633 start_codon:yes stop_codon:yes gene_type:complete
MVEDFGRMTVKQFQTALSSSSPTPGGGSASGLVLGNAAALTCMVCDLTTSNPKWKDGWAAAEKIQSIAIPILLDSIELANADSLAFEDVMKSWKLPKNNKEEEELRKEKIEEASLNAALAPLEIAIKSAEILELLPELAEKGNPNAITDVAVAALLSHASSRGALYNVRINLLDLERPDLNKKINKINTQIDSNLEKTLSIVEKSLNSVD